VLSMSLRLIDTPGATTIYFNFREIVNIPRVKLGGILPPVGDGAFLGCRTRYVPT